MKIEYVLLIVLSVMVAVVSGAILVKLNEPTFTLYKSEWECTETKTISTYSVPLKMVTTSELCIVYVRND